MALGPERRDHGAEQPGRGGLLVALQDSLAELVQDVRVPRQLQAGEGIKDGRPDSLVHHPEGHHKRHDARRGSLKHAPFGQPRYEAAPFSEDVGQRMPVHLQHGLLLVLVEAPPLPVSVPHIHVQLCKRSVGVLADELGNFGLWCLQEDHWSPQGAKPRAELHRGSGVAVHEHRGGRRLLAHNLPDELALRQDAPDALTCFECDDALCLFPGGKHHIEHHGDILVIFLLLLVLPLAQALDAVELLSSNVCNLALLPRMSLPLDELLCLASWCRSRRLLRFARQIVQVIKVEERAAGAD
mmetsp:Transcript_11934/g.32701  ORF Transcript_11934/g.32701 Transcript_11934/m.32701 type:complete len:298 (-) Transcript_11934:192-1085(-)